MNSHVIQAYLLDHASAVRRSIHQKHFKAIKKFQTKPHTSLLRVLATGAQMVRRPVPLLFCRCTPGKVLVGLINPAHEHVGADKHGVIDCFLEAVHSSCANRRIGRDWINLSADESNSGTRKAQIITGCSHRFDLGV